MSALPGADLSAHQPTSLPSARQLELLRRLDRRHPWTSLDDRRLCLGCGKLVKGRDIKAYRSMGGLGPLRLRCPSDNCGSGPLEWVLPNSAGAAEIRSASAGR